MKEEGRFTPSESLEAEDRRTKSLAEAEKYRRVIDETIAALKKAIPPRNWDKKISKAKAHWPLSEDFFEVIKKTITSHQIPVFTGNEHGEMTVREFVDRLEEQKKELLGS